MDGGVAAFFRADGPRAADILRPRRNGIVLSLAESVPDGMDRREIDHIETERRNVGKARRAILERSVPSGLGRAGPGENLIPGGKLRLLAIDDHRQPLLKLRRELLLRVAQNGAQQIRVER